MIVAVDTDGRREVLGMDLGPFEAETFWTAFLRKLARRGLRGVNLVVSDCHEGIKAAVSKFLTGTWQRCRVHFMRNALAHGGRSSRRVVSAFIVHHVVSLHTEGLAHFIPSARFQADQICAVGSFLYPHPRIGFLLWTRRD